LLIGIMRDVILQKSGRHVEPRAYGVKHVRQCAHHRHDHHSAARKSDPHARNGAQARPVIPSGECDPVKTLPCFLISEGSSKWESFLKLWSFLVSNYVWTQCEITRSCDICLIIRSGATAITSVLPSMRSAWSFETGASDRDDP
jgi:hypothetical protein